MQNINQKEICKEFNEKHFEIVDDFQKEMETVYAWIEAELSIRQLRSK